MATMRPSGADEPAARLRRRLGAAAREAALPALGPALGRWAAANGLDLARDAVREELERAARTIIVRVLFLLHAERAGRLPGATPAGGKAPVSALVAEAAARLDPMSTSMWDRFLRLVEAAWADAGTAADGLGDATRQPRLPRIPDPDFAVVLSALALDPASGGQLDYAALDLADLGHLYEELLTLRLVTVEADGGRGLAWLDHRGGRKGGGVYYTRRELVDHLVRQAVAPAFAEHLQRVEETAAARPARAAEDLLDFTVLDPACGGGYFLVAAADELAGQAARFLARTPLPRVGAALDRLAAGASRGAAVERGTLLRRLLLERCVFGADLSPAGVEVARLSLWAAAPVPGLPLGEISRNLQVGDALTGLDWPAAFPRVFARPNPGFDVVLGNPPWEEVTVERLAFYGLFAPGIRSLPQERRERALGGLLARRPDLHDLLDAERERAAGLRASLARGGYPPMPGDPDLYKYFCRRYRELLRDGGRLGVVLPRSAFATGGSEGFRRWLFEENLCERIDFLVNRRLWAFETHPQYTVALVAARRATPTPGAAVRVAGTATSPAEWREQAASPGLLLRPSAFGPGWTVPLLRDQAEAELLAKLRRGGRFPYGAGGRWRCFGVRELDETNDRRLWDGPTGQGGAPTRPLWKGESFEQYDPHGAGERACPETGAALARARKPRPGSGSLLARDVPLRRRRLAVLAELDRARVAFRDVSRATDSRTVRACLVPPRTFLTNKAPYLAFVDGDEQARAACLGVMNSLPFDWQARRFVEISLNFFVLEGLTVPDLAGDDVAEVARCAARLSCVDDRFAAFAASLGVETGPLPGPLREALRLEIDARIARSWGLSRDDLGVLLADFTLDAVPGGYRTRLAERLAELTATGGKVTAAAPPG